MQSDLKKIDACRDGIILHRSPTWGPGGENIIDRIEKVI